MTMTTRKNAVISKPCPWCKSSSGTVILYRNFPQLRTWNCVEYIPETIWSLVVYNMQDSNIEAPKISASGAPQTEIRTKTNNATPSTMIK